MPSLFFALLAAAFSTAAGREAVRVARLSQALGHGTGLLVVVWIAAVASSAFAAWLGSAIAPLLAPSARQMFVASALLIGALEIAFFRPKREPSEPTRSAGAMLIVLLAGQVSDGTRFLVLAISVATASPVLAAAGGALASGAVLSVAWSMGREWERRIPLPMARWIAAGLLLLAAIVIGLSARGIVD